jgi:hypothetical protein
VYRSMPADNCLLPVVQRIGPERVNAAFARKIRRPSSLAIALAQPAVDRHDAGYTATMTGSSEGKAWKQTLHDGLAAAEISTVPSGPLWLTVAVTTGPGRVRTNRKALIDSPGPILGVRSSPRRDTDSRQAGHRPGGVIHPSAAVRVGSSRVLSSPHDQRGPACE